MHRPPATQCHNAVMTSLKDIVETEAARLLDIEGVVAVAEGESDGEPCVVVYVDGSAHPPLPATLGGYPIVTRVSGPIEAQ